jgi:hypothetical protein
MKKLGLALAFVLLVMTGAYAAPASSAIALDTGYLISGLMSGGFGIGATYEYDFADNMGLAFKVGYVGVSSYGYTISMFMPGADFRLFFMAPKAGLYAFAGFQYWIMSVASYGFSFPLIDFGVGYKWVTGGESGFVVEPYIGYALALGSYVAGGGLEYGVRLGYAF